MHRTTRAATPVSALAFLGLALSTGGTAGAQDLMEVITNAAGVPQMPAFLPDRYSVPRSSATPVDGVWMISSIRKKIRLEQGRAVVIDPWLHMFVLKVQRDMVVMKDMQRSEPGVYTAYDLPLLGESTMRLAADGNLDVMVKGTLGPARFRLIRREVDDEQAFAREMDLVAGNGREPPPSYTGRPGAGPEVPPTRPPRDAQTDPLATCENLDLDATTGEVICVD